MGLDTPSWPNSEGMRPVFIDCGAPAGTSRAFPKFESYGMLEMAASVGRKVKDAIVWFHGIGRLACEKRELIRSLVDKRRPRR